MYCLLGRKLTMLAGCVTCTCVCKWEEPCVLFARQEVNHACWVCHLHLGIIKWECLKT